MDEIFVYMNGKYEVSLADSTMMWIVHCAMNKAQDRMKEKTGVLERLNEISKFYELAVIQLEGCLSIVHEAENENGCCVLEGNDEEVLEELREIKDRLQGRLEESESAILEKDRELRQILKNELQLRHALELKEKELVSLNNEQGGLCELRTSMDQQMLNIKQRLEEPQYRQHIAGSSDNDAKKIEEMGCDIDILKHTMDLAFGKMQSALFLGEIGPKERQWKLAIEKDIMSIFIKSFFKEFEKNNENHVHKCWQERWSQVMNEVASVRNELSALHETCPEDSDSSSLSSPTKPSPAEEVELPEEEEEEEEEENEKGGGNNYLSKLIKNRASIIRQKNEELNRIKHHISQEKKASSSKKRQELNSMKERIHSVTKRLDNLITWNAKPHESLFNGKDTHHDKETLSRKSNTSQVDEIDRVVKDVDLLESIIDQEKVNGVSDVGNKAEEEEEDIRRVLSMVEESDLQEHVHKCCSREVINEWNEKIERNALEGKIRDEINLIVLSEAVKEMMINYNKESVLVKCQEGGGGVEGENKYLSITLLESLLSCFVSEEENLMEHGKQLDSSSEQTFSSLTTKVENVLQQLGISIALVKQLGTSSLGHCLRGHDQYSQIQCFHNQMFDEQLKLLSSIDFEAIMVYHKLETVTMRLEKMKSSLDPVIKMVDSLRRMELLYQKAFITRCQNLQKAEAEVDLLGDQVDALLTLLDNIYLTLHQHAPVLRQYFEVFNILALIKTELISGPVRQASVVS